MTGQKLGTAKKEKPTYYTLRREWAQNKFKEEEKPTKIQQYKHELYVWLINRLPISVVDFVYSIPIETYLGFALWFLLFFVFIRLEFGVVFFICSLFFLMFSNLGQRKEGELSAYNVFNRGGKALPGQLTASQFESEILHKY
ncbi:hypothetical protein PROFUN_08173 [Planoprotostelium fungivorum]|uniref:SAYSvFN domain-containing protein n=1 Tax=Planoprotostelium fungivorum TaxID=1890364 RepID=A0A2P6N626_9EUKA|nr:hypothetical protein PROFUN_08173 [Planoprotostelium fungivorum]